MSLQIQQELSMIMRRVNAVNNEVASLQGELQRLMQSIGMTNLTGNSPGRNMCQMSPEVALQQMLMLADQMAAIKNSMSPMYHMNQCMQQHGNPAMYNGQQQPQYIPTSEFNQFGTMFGHGAFASVKPIQSAAERLAKDTRLGWKLIDGKEWSPITLSKHLQPSGKDAVRFLQQHIGDSTVPDSYWSEHIVPAIKAALGWEHYDISPHLTATEDTWLDNLYYGGQMGLMLDLTVDKSLNRSFYMIHAEISTLSTTSNGVITIIVNKSSDYPTGTAGVSAALGGLSDDNMDKLRKYMTNLLTQVMSTGKYSEFDLVKSTDPRKHDPVDYLVYVGPGTLVLILPHSNVSGLRVLDRHINLFNSGNDPIVLPVEYTVTVLGQPVQK